MDPDHGQPARPPLTHANTEVTGYNKIKVYKTPATPAVAFGRFGSEPFLTAVKLHHLHGRISWRAGLACEPGKPFKGIGGHSRHYKGNAEGAVGVFTLQPDVFQKPQLVYEH